jgi:hypothetical protein
MSPHDRAAAMKREIRAKDLVRDIRKGLTNIQLMDKYRLSAKGLLLCFRKLVEAKAFTAGELEPRIRDQVLQSPTCYPIMSTLYVYDPEETTVRGHVQDLSIHRIQVVGIQAALGDRKSLLLQATTFEGVFRCSLQGVCRWSRLEPELNEWVAVFEIVRISKQDAEKLKELIQATTYCDLE